MNLTAIILSKGEKSLEMAVESVKFCDEILIIKDSSFEGKAKIKQRIVNRFLAEDFSAQRNYAMKEAKGEWILFVDADEVVTQELAKEIEHEVQSTKHKASETAYYIRRRDYFWGKELKYGETRKARNSGIIRLVKKNSGRWNGRVHEVFVPAGKVGRLNSFLNHYPHQTLKELIGDINYYSTLRAKELLNNNVGINILQIIFYPLGKFVLGYFLYLGFLDGPAGFVYSFMMSFHSFLVRAKLYQYSKIDVAK